MAFTKVVEGLDSPLGIASTPSEPDRLYPQTSLAAHVIGYTDVDGRGTAGMERAFDDRLSNPATRGEPLTLSISSRLQQALEHELLERDVVPTFYERDARGIPRRWLQIVKQSIRTVLPGFSARRMVKDYVRDMYLPAVRRETLTI